MTTTAAAPAATPQPATPQPPAPPARRAPAPVPPAAQATALGQLMAARYLLERYGPAQVWHLVGEDGSLLVRGWCLADVDYEFEGEPWSVMIFRSLEGTYVLTDCQPDDEAAVARGDIDYVSTLVVCPSAADLRDTLRAAEDQATDPEYFEALRQAWDEATTTWPGLDQDDEIEVIP